MSTSSDLDASAVVNPNASQRKAARIAGFAQLFSFVIVVAVNFGVLGRLIVAGDVAQTARNILANEGLFCMGMAGDLIYCTGVIVLAVALYVVLKPVDQTLAPLSPPFSESCGSCCGW